MGGKKKKSLAQKLAKMSDEERARYAQHRADIEEEAKRRKEQLISGFLKKKIKNEEAFSRLNQAKINQQWHQLLRKIKCQEMRKNVEYLKQWINRVIVFKNNMISKLLEELEEAEEQYMNCFNNHSLSLNNIVEDQEDYVQVIDGQFHAELEVVLAKITEEFKDIENKAKLDQDHLKTVIFAQETLHSKCFKESYESYMQRNYEIEKTHQEEIEKMISERKDAYDAIWKQYLHVVSCFIKKNDKRRLQMGELKRLNAKNSEEIDHNERQILAAQRELEKLHNQLDNTQNNHENNHGLLKETFVELQKEQRKKRGGLEKQLEFDNKMLQCLTDNTTICLKDLEEIKKRGKAIVEMHKICKQFETESDFAESMQIIKNWQSDDQTEPVLEEYNHFECMEFFWINLNRVKMETKELKNERTKLLEQNKNLRGMLRAALEAVILNQELRARSKVSTRAQSKRASAQSAPLRRILM